MTMTRNKAIQVLDNERKEYIIKGCQLDKAIDIAIEALQREDRLLKSLETNEPIYDMVEVVRCKACKWWSGSVNTSHNNHLCKRALDQNVEYWTRGDDFCSYGERKGGEEK